MQSFAQVLAILIGSVVLAVAGAFLNRWLLAHQDKSDHHHQVGGYFLAVVGTLYALVLGLFVVNVQAKYEHAKTTAQAEANACSDMWNFSRGIAQPERRNLRACLKNYYEVVQGESWQKIAAGEEAEHGDKPYAELWQNLMQYEPSSERETAQYQACITSLQELSDARAYRTITGKRGLLPLVWVVIIIGGILVQVYTSLFVIDHHLVHVTLTVLVSAFIALNLVLVAIFDHPYDDHLQVKPGAFSFNPEILNDSKPNRTPEPTNGSAGAGGAKN